MWYTKLHFGIHELFPCLDGILRWPYILMMVFKHLGLWPVNIRVVFGKRPVMVLGFVCEKSK